MLTDEQIAAFHDTGWLTIASLFNGQEIHRMRACFDELENIASRMAESGLCRGSYFVLGKKAGERVIKRVVWAGAAQPYLSNVGADARLTVPASQLLRSARMDHLLCQAHFKRPRDGVIFDWHQDIQHRDKGAGTWRDVNGSGSFVQTLIVIDEMTADSGPLMFIPGSSHWGRVDFGDHDYDNPNYRHARPPQFREEDAVTILAQPGDTLFFGPYTAHASFENTSDHYRRVLINGYAYPGANHRVYPGDGAGRSLSVDRVENLSHNTAWPHSGFCGMSGEARGAWCGCSTRASSNDADRPQRRSRPSMAFAAFELLPGRRCPYGFCSSRPSDVVALLANDHRHSTRRAPRRRA